MSTKNDGGGSNLPTVRRGVRAHEVMTFESSALIRKVRDVSLAECPGIKAKVSVKVVCFCSGSTKLAADMKTHQ